MPRKKPATEPSIEGEKWLEKEVRPLLTGYVLHAPAEDIPIEHVVQAWSILDFIEGLIADRKAALRLRLLDEAESNGKPTDKGGQRLFISGSTVLREKRVAKSPSEDVVRKLIAEAKLKLVDVFDEQTVLVLNPSKLDLLVDTGKLDAEALEASKKVSWALKVFASPILQELLGGASEKVDKGKKKHQAIKTESD